MAFFFFQAEDGIRDDLVTGVQTCALPISPVRPDRDLTGETPVPRAQRTVPTRRLHLKCFTAIEILHLAWLGKRSVEQTLCELREAGLDSLTGGGAEIFRKEVRSAIAKGKESAEEYLDVHRA